MTYISPEGRGLADIGGQILSSIAERCGRLHRTLQHARMKSVLAQMPDEVLEQIGIGRSDIPEYARSLIDGA